MKIKFNNPFRAEGILSGKRVLTATLVATALIGTTVFEVADTENPNIRSKGRIEYTDSTTGDTVIIDSADFVTLDNQIITLEGIVKTVLDIAPETDLTTINISNINAGDVVLTPNGKIKSMSALSDDERIGGPFSGLLAKSITVDTSIPDGLTDSDGNPVYAATDNSLSKGAVAWNTNGELVIGTGGDNENSYNLGYTEGLAKALDDIHIEYTYHEHTDDCYRTWYTYSWPVTTERMCYITKYSDAGGTFGRTDCGKKVTWSWGSAQSATHGHTISSTHTEYGEGWEVPSGKTMTGSEQRACCGKTEETIESATLIFD